MIAAGLLLLMLGGLTSELRAEDRGLPAAEQAQLAEQFAPVLVFHPDEKYFPTNPLFPLEPAVVSGDAGLPSQSSEHPTPARPFIGNCR